MEENRKDICPICRNEAERQELKSFYDYSLYLYSKLCEGAVKLANGELNHDKKEELVLLSELCKTIHQYAYSHDHELFGRLAIPKNEDSQ